MAVTARVTGTSIGASSQADYAVPLPPRPGEIRPWFLVDKVVSVGNQLSLLPSMDDNFEENQSLLILGYGCPPEQGETAPGYGKLVFEQPEVTRDLPIRWFDLGDEVVVSQTGCAWLIGEIDTPLQPGAWAFYPPSFDGTFPELPSLRFRVLPQPSENR